jgi:hypothetical protein
MLKGAKTFQIQQFSTRNPIDRNYLQVKPYAAEEIERMAKMVRPYFDEVRTQGI